MKETCNSSPPSVPQAHHRKELPLRVQPSTNNPPASGAGRVASRVAARSWHLGFCSRVCLPRVVHGPQRVDSFELCWWGYVLDPLPGIFIKEWAHLKITLYNNKVLCKTDYGTKNFSCWGKSGQWTLNCLLEIWSHLSNEQKLDRDLHLLFCHWFLKLGAGKISCM